VTGGLCRRRSTERDGRSPANDRSVAASGALLGDAGWSSPVARQAHNLKVVGSNPTPATKTTLRTSSVRPSSASSVASWPCTVTLTGPPPRLSVAAPSGVITIRSIRDRKAAREPPSSEWPMVLDRMLLQFQKTTDDVGISHHLVREYCTQSNTVGDFLTKASVAVAQRVDERQLISKLPQLLFVITSSGDVTGESNRIRRAGRQALAAEPLLNHSPRSEAGKWWTERNRDPNHQLGYIISLFNATLITMSASAVVHACVLAGEDDLRGAALHAKAQPNSGSALQAVKASEFFRFLSGAAVPEFTTGQKGRAQDTTLAAYAAIQALSAKRHKAINQAICGLTRNYVEGFECHPTSGFEIAQGGDLFTDAIITIGARTFHTEFHHLSKAQCKAASMSSYIMGKLRGYAIYHQLIPR
jgi:hypothetical protein